MGKNYFNLWCTKFLNFIGIEILSKHIVCKRKSVLKSVKLYTYLILFDLYYSPPAVTPTSTGKDNKGQIEVAPNEYVILLADSMLMHMPLEALEFLQVENVTAMCRDFSLSLFHHRFYKDEATGEERERKRERAGFKFTLSFTKVCIFTVVCMTVYTYVQSHDIVLLSRYIQNHTLFPCGHSWLMSNLQFVVTMSICSQWLEMIIACLHFSFQIDNLFIL